MDGTDPSMQNRGPTVLSVNIIMLSFSTTFIVLRLISRIGVVGRVSKDDYAIVVAWLIAFGFSFSICYGTSVGLGRHEVDVLPQQRMPLKKAEYAFSVLYNPALMATKTSICLFYLTLSRNQKVFKWMTWTTLIVVNVAGVALTFLNIAQCRPVGAAFDDPIPPNAKCIDIVSLYLSSAPVNIISDIALLFLPMPILTGIRLPRNEKLILIITFSFGAFVAVVDVVRIAYLQSAAVARLQVKSGSAAMDEEGDYSWIASLSFMWSAVEVHVGMICACVPGVKPLVTKIWPSLLGKLKAAGELQGNPFFGPGDAQWANLAPRNPTSEMTGTTLASASRTPSQLPAVAQPSSTMSHSREKSGEDAMYALDFLTTPDMNAPPLQTGNTHTEVSNSETRRPRTPSLAVFDFVNIKNPKSMVKMTNRESLCPLALVTILFFMWGFAYGLLDILNQQFQIVVGISGGQAVGLHSAYYGAYFIAPLTFGQYIFRRWGFKTTFITGLCIYGIGTLVFWPSAVLASFSAFLISNFIIGLGVATLETAGNPFISLCGPPEYAEVRLNVSQGVQAIGSVISPILAKKVLFRNVVDAPSLIDVQWTYLGIALFAVILALVFFYLPIPEASDDELEQLAELRESVNRRKVFGLPVVYTTLLFGIFSQFCYVGGQESVANYLEGLVAYVRPNSQISPFDYLAIGRSIFAVGRFLTALLTLILKPRYTLLLLYAGAIITSALAMSLPGTPAIVMLLLLTLFESGIFSLLFAISLRGMGSHTKWAAVLLAAATSGGAVLPAIMSAVQANRNIQYAFCVVVATFSFGALMPIYLNVIPAAKKQVDPVYPHKKNLRVGPDRQSTDSGMGEKEFEATVGGAFDGAAVEHLEVGRGVRRRSTSGLPAVEAGED